MASSGAPAGSSDAGTNSGGSSGSMTGLLSDVDDLVQEYLVFRGFAEVRLIAACIPLSATPCLSP